MQGDPHCLYAMMHRPLLVGLLRWGGFTAWAVQHQTAIRLKHILTDCPDRFIEHGLFADKQDPRVSEASVP
jgi:hypothetical protein